MMRASPIDLRKAMEVARELTRAGVEFVCMPVLNDEDRVKLLTQQCWRMANILKQAEEDEGGQANATSI